MGIKSYPELQINQRKLYENVQEVVQLCSANNISVSGVVKGVCGQLGVIECFVAGGCAHIASSRVDQLKRSKEHNKHTETMLLRIPMHSEMDEMIKWTDISLNSEKQSILWLEEACERASKHHGVVLMMDLGDLREGCFEEDELVDLALFIERELKWVTLRGIGTNLGCYGAIKPTPTNLGKLSDTAQRIEAVIGRELEIVSGGATSSLPLLVSGKMPKKINNLRVGEGILLNMDLPEIWGVHVGNLHNDVFTLNAQIIEIKRKPSYPVGEIFIDAFGNTPAYEDRGTRTRAILAIGKQDFAMDDKLIPLDRGVQIVGSSSDHLIVDIEDSLDHYEVGDIMSFGIFYGPMLHLCTSSYVTKSYVSPISLVQSVVK